MAAIVVRDEVAEGVGHSLEQRVEALLGEDEMEDLRQAPVRLDQRLGRSMTGAGLGLGRSRGSDVLHRHAEAIGVVRHGLEARSG